MASMGGILKNKNQGGNISQPQSALQVRNKKKSMKREMSKQSLRDAESMRGLSKDSKESESMSDESRSVHLINIAKQSAQLAVQNRELNK